MHSQSEIKEQLALESRRRTRLGVSVAAAGVLFLLSAIIVNSVLSSLPSVGLLQGLGGALRGEARPAVSARAPEVRFLSHHAFGLIAGSALEAIALFFLVLVLLMLLDAIRFRRPEISPISQTLVIVGGAGLAVVGLAEQITRAIRTHSFALGHDFGEHAVEQAITKGTANTVVLYLGLLAPLLLAIGMIMVLMNATRAGLITRWLRGLGIAAAIVTLPFFAGIFELQLIPAAWMVAMGFLFLGKLPNGDPPAWAAGESRPWPSQAELRAEAIEQKGEKSTRKGKESGGDSKPDPTASKAKRTEVEPPAVEPPAAESASAETAPSVSPAPVVPPQGSPGANRRRRKRH